VQVVSSQAAHTDQRSGAPNSLKEERTKRTSRQKKQEEKKSSEENVNSKCADQAF
jgi:hypothetical protein